MKERVAAMTAFAMTAFVWAPQSSAAEAAPPAMAELLFEDSYTDSGLEVHVAATRDAAGSELREATVTAPDTSDELDVWTDGVTSGEGGGGDGEPGAGDGDGDAGADSEHD